jgi:hypothetical protein
MTQRLRAGGRRITFVTLVALAGLAGACTSPAATAPPSASDAMMEHSATPSDAMMEHSPEPSAS